MIVALIVLFIIFAVGSVRRANEKREQARQESLAVESSIAEEKRLLGIEAQALIDEAAKHAASCDFDKAIEVLDSFTGDPDEYPDLLNARYTYENGEDTLVLWEDVKSVPVLSFGRLLVDDGSDPFDGKTGSDDRYYNITTGEFTAILEQLYNNGFMLVDLYDLFTTTKAEDGSTLIVTNELKLPAGKKPILLIHCQPEGYNNPLVLTDEGFETQLSQEDGTTTLGDFDFVPLLESFIETHAGFSYRGARGIIAVTAYNGLFGHSLEDTATINQLISALRETGYTIAGNTYGNERYGKLDLLEVQDDLAKWEANAEPLLGDTEVLVYARSSDISNDKSAYTSKKYEKLYMAGFRYYFGLCYNSSPWMTVSENTVRIGRLMVTGNNLEQKDAFFANLFDSAAVMDPHRK